MAAVYHFKRCRAILVGFRKQLQKDGLCRGGFVGILEAGMEQMDVPPVLPCLLFSNKRGQVLKAQVEDNQIFRDDLTGQLLNPELVRAARKNDLEHVEDKSV